LFAIISSDKEWWRLSAADANPDYFEIAFRYVCSNAWRGRERDRERERERERERDREREREEKEEEEEERQDGASAPNGTVQKKIERVR
jgi:hypothetical protein